MSELQDKLNEFDVFDKLNTFEDILLFLKKHPYYGSSSGRDEYYALTYYILEDYRKSVSFLVGCSKFRYKSDTKSARIQLVKLLIFNALYCKIVL